MFLKIAPLTFINSPMILFLLPQSHNGIAQDWNFAFRKNHKDLGPQGHPGSTPGWGVVISS